LELLKRMKLKLPQVISGKLTIWAYYKKTVYSYLYSFSSVQNDLYTGTIQKLYNYSGTLNVFLFGKELGQLLIQMEYQRTL
jgi:hypothetical protein